MKFDQQMLRLYAVTDRRWLSGRSLEDVVEEALAAGITMVQLREKHMDPEQFLKEACSLRVLCHRYHVPLLIDDSPEICLRSGADGVHVGQDDMSVQKTRALLGPDKIIGATAHNVAEALMAERLGADYLGCGAAFGSHTKENARPIDRSTYRDITSAVHIPVCAIGGITEENIGELRHLGLSGVAVISGIFASDQIGASCRRLLQLSSRL